MKQIYKYAIALVCILMASVSFTACEFDSSPEYDHPLYVTYTISASDVEFNGPDQLLIDILAWIKANSVIYDVKVNYSNGSASEFAEQDADARKKYDEFVPKFNAYLDEVRSKLTSGTYGSGVSVNAKFATYANRTQGESGHLKYEEISFVYPE